MKISPLGYTLADLIRDLIPYSPKFLTGDLLNSSLFAELNKAIVLNSLITDRKPDETLFDENLKFKTLAAIIYEEAIELELIPDFFKINFSIEVSDPSPGVIIEGDIFEDRTELRITAQASGSMDLTNFPFLKRMKKENDKYVPDDTGELVIPIASQQFIFELNSNLEFNIRQESEIFTLDFPPCQIDNTGFIFEVDNLGFKGKFPDFSLAVENARIIPPEDLLLPGNIPFPGITIQNGSLSRNGISGKFSADWDLQFNASASGNPFKYTIQGTEYPATLFGTGENAIKGGFSSIEFSFEDNKLVQGAAQGKILLPYFDQPIDIQLNFNSAKDFSVILTSLSSEGLELTKEDLLKVNVKKLGLEQKDGVNTFSISGGLEPLFFTNEGMKWPRMDLKEL